MLISYRTISHLIYYTRHDFHAFTINRLEFVDLYELEGQTLYLELMK